MGTPTRTRRGLQLFSRSHPVSGDRRLSLSPVWDEAAVEVLPEFFAAGGSAGVKLFCDPSGTDDHCLNLSWLRFGGNYPLPRHSHSGDCLYYIVAGELRLGNRTLRAGEGFFVPSDAPYGYTAGPEGVELLEFRGEGRPHSSKLLETRSSWRRVLESVRANRARWKQELQPYEEWSKSVPSRPYETPTGERKSLTVSP
jgi:hypothetical protein